MTPAEDNKNAEKFISYIEKNLPKNHRENARQLATVIAQESHRHRLDPLFVTAVIQQESRFVPTVKGSKGEIGLMQVMPSTARWINQKLKLNLNIQAESSIYEMTNNIKIGTAYMAYLKNRHKLTEENFLSAYNMGPKKLRDLNQNGIKPSIYKNGVFAKYDEVKLVVSN